MKELKQMCGKSKFWLILASVFLLLSFVGHSVGHYVSYLNQSGFDAERIALAETMKNYQADKMFLNTSAWTMINMYSLSLALQYLFGGLINLLLLRVNLSNGGIKQVAAFNALFWTVSFILILLLNPVIQPLIISLTAGVLFGIAWLKTETLSS